MNDSTEVFFIAYSGRLRESYTEKRNFSKCPYETGSEKGKLAMA
jgi:hypothetical protein